ILPRLFRLKIRRGHQAFRAALVRRGLPGIEQPPLAIDACLKVVQRSRCVQVVQCEIRRRKLPLRQLASEHIHRVISAREVRVEIESREPCCLRLLQPCPRRAGLVRGWCAPERCPLREASRLGVSRCMPFGWLQQCTELLSPTSFSYGILPPSPSSCPRSAGAAADREHNSRKWRALRIPVACPRHTGSPRAAVVHRVALLRERSLEVAPHTCCPRRALDADTA